MPSWLLKAVTQRLIGALPNPHFWNGLLQTRITGSIRLASRSIRGEAGRVPKAARYLRALRQATPCDFTALELGTGWFPVVPIGLFLCGASQVWTWDITEHLRLDRVRFVLESFLRLDAASALRRHLPDVRPERFNKLREVAADRSLTTPARLLERLSIEYRIGDATHSGIAPGSVDLVTSSAVLEVLPIEALTPLFGEFLRVAATEAVMSHRIVMSDYYASFDCHITPLNFLKFSDRTWRWLNNPIVPFNRLRITDYRRVLRDVGFKIIDETVVDRCDASMLAKINLAPRFRCYPEEDLLVLQAWVAATPGRNPWVADGADGIAAPVPEDAAISTSAISRSSE